MIRDALAKYILDIIIKHGPLAPRLCNKDPMTLRSMPLLVAMFPASRFILMVRDGRAVAHSLFSRRVTILGFDTQTYLGALKGWERAMSAMHADCESVGSERCLIVHYEQLVLHPRLTLRRVLDFLDLPWHGNVMRHAELISSGHISLSK